MILTPLQLANRSNCIQLYTIEINLDFQKLCYNMAKRITIMLDDDLLKKLHEVQAKQIKDTSESVSFSAVLNETLRKRLK